MAPGRIIRAARSPLWGRPLDSAAAPRILRCVDPPAKPTLGRQDRTSECQISEATTSRPTDDLSLQFLMTAITQRCVAALLASAEVDCLGFGGLEFHRGESAALVAAIAERLLGTSSAGAPEVTFTRAWRR
jgi:hypothetical protein